MTKGGKSALTIGVIIGGCLVGPGIVGVLAAKSGLTGAAALVKALVTFGPGGIKGGIITTGVTSGVSAGGGAAVVDKAVEVDN